MSSEPEAKQSNGHQITDYGEDSREKTSESPRPHMNRLVWLALVSSVLCAVFLFALDMTIVAAVQPRIIQDLGGIEKLAWISVAFNLGGASANLCWGKLYDQFEHKTLFLVSTLLFEIGSAVCGAAPNMNTLIVGRTLCGLGGNGLYMGTMNILSNLTTIKERPLYLGFMGVTWGAGVVLGPIFGGAFTSNPHVGWRWSFYINICIAAVFAPVYLFILPTHHPQSDRTTAQRLRRLDYVGATLFIGSYTAGIMAISFGGAMFAWSSARIIALFCTSGVLMILFVIQQSFANADCRLFPVHLLRAWENWLFFAQTAASITILFLPVYFIPLYFQFVYDYSPLKASIHLLPFICVAVVFVLLNGGLMSSLGFYMPWYLFGSVLALIGSALMRTISINTNMSNIYGYSVLIAAGVGAFVQAGFPIAQAKNPPQEIANVLAFMGCAQLTGLTFGFAVGNAVFVNIATSRIAAILPNATHADVQAAIAGATSLSLLNLSPGTKDMIFAALTGSIDKVYDVVLASACLCLALTVCMKREKLFMN